MDDDAFARLLEALAEDPECNRLNMTRINKPDLQDDLGWAETGYSVRCQQKSGSSVRDRLALAEKTAKRLATLLCEDDIRKSVHIPAQSECELDRLIKAIQCEVQRISSRVARHTKVGNRRLTRKDGRLSPFEWLCGDELPGIFRKHFCLNPTPRRADGMPSTLYIRFTLEALDALGVKKGNGRNYAPEAIVRAMSRPKGK